MKRIVILGAGESGAGAAVLAKKEGFDVFVSDMSAISDKYKKMLDDRAIAWEEGRHTEELILNADEIIKSPGIPDTAPIVAKAIEKGIRIISMLGHSMNAVALPKDGTLTYEFMTEREGKATLRTALIPTQPNDSGDLRYSVSIDGGEPKVYTLKEKFRSEGWKQNVLRGQAVRELPVELSRGRHTLTIRALDNHIVVDQWMLDYNPQRKHYLFPVTVPDLK